MYSIRGENASNGSNSSFLGQKIDRRRLLFRIETEK